VRASLDLLAVVGPTASGKTDLAIELAERLDGELISADSRQVYRECDIGTNKPDLQALRGIPCHVIDVVDPGELFTVADYQGRALAAITQVRDRGHLPILQGGTGLYVRALLDGWNLGDAPPDPALRATLEARLESEGMEALEAELRRVDPTAADRAQRNPRRLIRALEIYAATGRPPSQARRVSPPPWTSLVVGLEVPLAELDRRIEARVDRMLASGLIEEVQRVQARFPHADLRRLGHGYPEIAAYGQGTVCLPDARQDIIKQVRQYARRQYTWFRADARVQWIDPTGGPDAVMRLLG
jgi:tRNA dimethylallyltransferase